MLRFVLAARRPPPPFRLRCLRCSAACGASGAARASGASCSIGSILWSRYNTNDKDDPRSQTTLPSRSVSRKRMCLKVTGPLRATSSEPTPLFSVILERMSSPRLPSTLLALASWAQRHHPDELNCPPETKLGPSMWSTLKGFVGGRAARRGSPRHLGIAAAAPGRSGSAGYRHRQRSGCLWSCYRWGWQSWS